MKAMIAVVLLLTVAPVVAVTTLCVVSPERWGGSLSLINILFMAVFGVLTVPLWPTYIPTIILTPIIMPRIARHPVFLAMSFMAVVAISIPVGAVCGTAVMAPIILLALADGPSMAMMWMLAGAASGAVTSAILCCVYKLG